VKVWYEDGMHLAEAEHICAVAVQPLA